MNLFILLVLFYSVIYSTQAALNLDYLDPTILQTRTSISTQQDAAIRIILKYSSKVSVTVDTGLFNDNKDSFNLHVAGGILHISASTGVAAVWGFNYYLKKYCKSHIGWQVQRVNIPDPLPEADETVVASDRFRYYQNVCTFSYSFVWWNITQWTDHVEWMALNGINLPLAPVDQEAAWAKVYRNIGMSEKEIDKQFTGPAFLSWLRMGNLHGWGGPLYKSWHDRQSTIQIGVIKQMYDLGMIPVLPAFSGHVPKAFSRIYPRTQFHQVSDWNNFGSKYSCGLFLSPSDPLFKTIGQMYLQEITAEIMPSHIYSADPFNEVVLPNMTSDVIKSSAKAMFSAIEQVDKDAVWLVQNWMFVNMANLWSPKNAKAFLSAVPNGRMLVLDLEAEHNPKYDKYLMYYGQPFIWCMLHNFGGTLGLVGKVMTINKQVYDIRSRQNSTMIGIGLTPEGINTNYMVYDFMLETGWRRSSVLDLGQWIENYAERRYGCNGTGLAWKSLLYGIYDYEKLSDIYGRNIYVQTKMPTFKTVPTAWYSSQSIFKAFNFLAFAPRNCHSSGYYHDLVDVTRQALLYRSEQIYYYRLRNKSLDVQTFNASVNQYLDILHDMEKILATNDDFTIQSWLLGARSISVNPKERENYEFNARNQITWWGPNGQISDYATKQWAEIFHYYYIPRWTVFLSAALDAKVKNITFDHDAAQHKVREIVESKFPTMNIDWLPKSDPVELSRFLYNKWKNVPDLPDLPETSFDDNRNIDVKVIRI